MLASQFLSHDSSLTLIHCSLEQLDGVCVPEEARANHLVFVKNQKFMSKLETRIGELPKGCVAVVFDSKLWEALTTEQKDQWNKQLGMVALSTNVPLSLARLSYPTWQMKMGHWQNAVDGRQMGTTTIDATAIIAQGVFLGESVKIGARVQIMPGCVIMSGSSISDDSILFPNVTVYSSVHIGKRARIHAGTVIGSDGYGYTFHQGVHHKIWHSGGVVIHDDVELGANNTVDGGTFTPTVIGSGTKTDNLVQIAHNTKLGKGVILCGQSGVSGSAVLEDYVVLGGKAGVGPDAHIGMGSQLAGAALVNEGAVWPAGSLLGGHPARDIKEWMRGFAYLRKVSLKK